MSIEFKPMPQDGKAASMLQCDGPCIMYENDTHMVVAVRWLVAFA